MQNIITIIGILSSIYTLCDAIYHIYFYYYNSNMEFRYDINKIWNIIFNKPVKFRLTTTFTLPWNEKSNSSNINIIQNLEKYISFQYKKNYKTIVENSKFKSFIIGNNIIINILQEDTPNPYKKKIRIRENVQNTIDIASHTLINYGNILNNLCENFDITSRNNNLKNTFTILYNKKEDNPLIKSNTRMILHNDITNFDCEIPYYNIFNKIKDKSSNQPIDFGLTNVSISESNFNYIEIIAPTLLNL